MRKSLNLTVLVAALGYFVDMFDLTIFGVVRVASLKDLGVDHTQMTSVSVWLINMGAAGMLVGGLVWGILGDKKGRLSVLFGSIFLYSIANLLSAFVTSIPQYAALRFVAGVGLAGELGAAVTLVSEMMGKEDRGYGTTIIAALGLLGAVTASLMGQFLTWKVAYLIGGGMGFALLATRLKMADSGMFHKIKQDSSRGDVRLFLEGPRLKRYFCCILTGVPIYFATGILMTFAPEISQALGLTGVTAGNALLFGSVGLTVGDLLSGLASQWLHSRKQAINVSLSSAMACGIAYFLIGGQSTQMFLALCFGLGLACGYWAVLVTMAAEQFGTNIRNTAATSIPNFVRSSVIVLTSGFVIAKAHLGVIHAAEILGLGVFAMAFWALSQLEETYGKDLDFSEAAVVPHAITLDSPDLGPVAVQ